MSEDTDELLILTESSRVGLQHPFIGRLDGYKVAGLTWFKLEDVGRVTGKEYTKDWLDTVVERLRQNGIEAIRAKVALIESKVSRGELEEHVVVSDSVVYPLLLWLSISSKESN